MNQRQMRWQPWVAAAVKMLVVVLVAWFVRDTLREAWVQVRQSRFELRAGWLCLAGGLYLAGLLPAGLFWYAVLRRLGQKARLGETLRAYYIGHLGKYVPGKAMVVVLRAGLLQRGRVQTSIAAASVFFETLTMMAVGACLAAAILAVRLREERFLLLSSLGLMIVALLPTLPPVFRRLARLAGVGRTDPLLRARLDQLGFGTLLAGWLGMLVVWAMLAWSLWATLRAIGAPARPLADWVPCAACVSLAMVAGFLSLIPGGLGVRDLILVKLLVPLLALPAGQAALASALLRLVWLVSELAVSIILYVGVGREPAAPQTVQPADESTPPNTSPRSEDRPCSP